jgi:MFS family permease
MTETQSVAVGDVQMAARAREEDPTAGWGQFRRLWLATAISSIGDGVRLTALPLLALSLTTDPILLALVMVANWGPLLLSPFAGVWADIFNRRALLIAVDIGRTIVVGLLALTVLTNTVTLAIVCVASALLGLGETVFVVAAQAFLPMVVHPSRLAEANGRLHVAQLVLRDSIGQPLGGVVFVAVASLPFLLDGASFFLGLLLLATIRYRPAPAPAAANGQRPHWRTMMGEGFRHLRGDRLLMLLAVMVGTLNFFAAGIGALEVLYVVQWLGLSESLFGVFLATGALGGVAGAMLSARIAKAVGLFPAALAALFLAGVSVLMLGLLRTPVLAAVAFSTLGLGGAIYQALTVSFRQATVPSEILGRISGVYRLVGTGTAPVGAIAAGVLAKLAGVNVPFIVAGIGVVALAVITTGPLLRMTAGRTDTARGGELR